MASKGKSPKIKVFGTPEKIRPIPRSRDNTDDLNAAEDKVHQKFAHIKAPQGTRNKPPTKGAFDPTSDSGFNANTVVAPPQTGG